LVSYNRNGALLPYPVAGLLWGLSVVGTIGTAAVVLTLLMVAIVGAW